MSKKYKIVENWLKKHNITYDHRTNSLCIDDEIQPLQIILSKMRVDLSAKGINTRFIKDAVIVWMDKRDDEFIDNIRNTPVVPDPDENLKLFLFAITGCYNILHYAILQHFIWQVKRKINNLEVYNHIMPVLKAPPASGKTTIIYKLLEPMEQVTYFNQFGCSLFRNKRLLAELKKNYIVVFNNMEELTQESKRFIKNNISFKSISYRPMYKNFIDVLKNNATFIGASNKNIQELIYDPTSARRFWQINTLDKMDWDAINNIDYNSIWNSIDYKNDSPIKNHILQISKTQDEVLRVKDSVEEWADEELEESRDDDWETSTDLYTNYKLWAKEFGYNPVNITRFGLKMKNMFNSKKSGQVKYQVKWHSCM